MRRFRYTSLTIRIGALVLFSSFVSAKEPPGFRSNQEKSFEKSAQTTLAAILNINNFTSWQRGDGQGQYGPPFVNGDGGVYPRGTSWVVFADGFVWGAKAYLDSLHTQTALAQLIRVGGSTYNVGNEIGWIEGVGPGARAIGSSDPRARIYRIRRDWTTMTDAELRRDAAENQQMPISSVSSVQTWEIQFQYQKDWDEWPVQYGAPYIERNGIPGYQKPPPFSASFTPDSLIYGNYDEPGIAGANADYPAGQVLWTAFNDLNRNTMLGFAGCEPMGLELQLTLWGYDQPGGLENLYFRRLLMINKGGADIGGGSKGSLFLDSVFVGQWVDPDVGHFGNDLNGCDTVLQMGYTYNAYPTDAEFSRFNLPPPAVGYVLLGGPVVPSSPGDSAIRGFAERAGFKNLRMTSFYPKATGSAISDPTYDYDGALRWWRLLNGYLPDFSSSPWRLYPSPPGEPETKFPMAGDPVARTGFLDGLGTS